MPKKSQRKPTAITFVLSTDYTDPKNKLVHKYARLNVLKAIKAAMLYSGLNNYEIVTIDSKDYGEQIDKRNIPELWMHDSGKDIIAPFAFDYYVLEFDNGTRKIMAMLPPEFEDTQSDPMFG